MTTRRIDALLVESGTVSVGDQDSYAADRPEGPCPCLSSCLDHARCRSGHRGRRGESRCCSFRTRCAGRSIWIRLFIIGRGRGCATNWVFCWPWWWPRQRFSPGPGATALMTRRRVVYADYKRPHAWHQELQVDVLSGTIREYAAVLVAVRTFFTLADIKNVKIAAD